MISLITPIPTRLTLGHRTSFHPPGQIKSIGFVLKTLAGSGGAVEKSIGIASHSFKGKHGCRGVGYRLPLG